MNTPPPFEFRRFVYWIVPLFAILLPFLVIRTFPEFFHRPDIRAFQTWAQAWNEGAGDVYLNCPTCNYPFVGTALSAGLMNSIDFENMFRKVNRFRYYLALADGVNVLLVWFILARFKVRAAPLWAGLIGLVPSSWLGASVWGQIDGVGQTLLLAFFALLLLFHQKNRGGGVYYLFLAAFGVLLSLMLMTKQLIYFSVIGLGVILLAGIVLRSRRFLPVMTSILTVGIFTAAPILLVDANLRFGDGYYSHIHYILATGSDHGDKISSLGFNIWSLVTDDVRGSSHLPLTMGGLSLAPFTPYIAGFILFFILNGIILFLFIRDLRQSNEGSSVFNLRQLLAALMYFAMVNIVFNVALTGTHERYLFHFFSFILAASIIWQNRPLIVAAFTASLLYGVYIFAYLNNMFFRRDQEITPVATLVHLAFFICLLIFWVRNSTSQTLDKSTT